MMDFPNNRARSLKIQARREAFVRLRTLIKDVPDAETPWPEIAEQLGRLSTKVVNGICYRVERALEAEYERGRRAARTE